jgi:radical SAM protein with 4Fe4S-binding SPASM domain
MRATMTTGGLTLTRRRADALAEAGLQHASLSIDGLAATHDALRTPGGFDRAIDALGHLRAAGVSVGANTQINRRTLGELVELGGRLADAGINAWQLILTIAHGNAADEPDLVLQPYMMLALYAELEQVVQLCEARRITIWPGNNLGYFGPLESRLRRHQNAGGHYRGCQAGASVIGIQSDGHIKSCPTLGGPANTGGSIREHALETIWDQAPELRALSQRTVDDLWGFCRTCYYAKTCMGGCSATSEPLLGRPGNNPFCHHRALELERQGLRERIEPIAAADPASFGFGAHRLVTEAIPTNGDSAPVNREGLA